MSFLEELVDEIESAEQDAEMYFSTYFIPSYYQPLESSPQ